MPRIISIDGNIGAGKSTLINELKMHFNNKKNSKNLKIIFLPEPVNVWEKITDHQGKTIIEEFYKDPKKFAFSFQMMAYISRLSIIKKALMEKYDLIFTERCVFTDKNIFAKMLYNDGKINEIEYKIYNSWFYEFIKEIPQIEYIYLRTDSNIAFERICKRGRKGENISKAYLETCHHYHEEWFKKESNPCIILDGNHDTDKNPEIIDEWIREIVGTVDRYEITFDGASRGNPGKCGCGYIIWLDNEIIMKGKKYLCEKNTNNYAEYNGLILGLEKCLELNIKNIIVKGDSDLIIKQINKEYKITSDNLIPLFNRVMDLLYHFNSFEFIHIKRKLNHRADALANESINDSIHLNI